jgi:DNA-binding Lrp family transcriptional regulator
MPTFSQRIVLLKVVSWSLRILAVLLLIIIAISVITSLPNVTPNSPNLSNTLGTLIEENLLLVVAVAVIVWISSMVWGMITHQEDDLDDKLLGYVISNPSTDIAALATWMNLTRKEVADRLAKLASAGEVKGVTIDLASGTISRGSLPVQDTPPANQTSYQTPPQTMASVQNVAPEPAQVPVESDEAIKMKAKLYELEILKQQGKIGVQSYDKLKEEYERKLAQADTGTKVY